MKNAKAHTTDCFGNALSTLSVERLTEIHEAMKLERKQNSFWNEGVKFQRKHTATMELVITLINEKKTLKKEIRQVYKQYVSRYGNGSKKTQIRSWFEYIADKDKALVSEVITEMSAVERRLSTYLESPLYLNKIRKYANYMMYSDVEAFEVTKVVSAKCVEVRRLKATIVRRPSDFEAGGFVGHYHDNHRQEWSFESDESQETMRIRLTKKGWKHGRHMKFQMSDSPYEFYDFNF